MNESSGTSDRKIVGFGSSEKAEEKEEAIASINTFSKVQTSSSDSSAHTSVTTQPLPRPSKRRQSESLKEQPFDLEAPPNTPLHELNGGLEAPRTVFYLAYGSNLCHETFQGRRKIKPLSAVNVVVPELIMTFDLAGIPYLEPCFANTRYRSPKSTTSSNPRDEKDDSSSASAPLIQSPTPSLQKKNYHNPYWPKGLVGVVYEVTLKDFAQIIATEGGGASYQDVLVDCYELAPGSSTVPDHPTVQPFRVHTLYSPPATNGGRSSSWSKNSTSLEPQTNNNKSSARSSRPNPDYAQPSARYLNLLTTGADEHDIPQEYKTYLHQLRPYTVTTLRQRIGALVLKAVWFPLLMTVLMANRKFADDKGKTPKWLAAISGAIFTGVWVSYDYFFKYIFGDGERTIENDGGGRRRGRNTAAGVAVMVDDGKE